MVQRHEPPGETWIERTIRRAVEAGEFDDLPGVGEPIPDLGATYDPAWWAKKFVARERLTEEAMQLRARIRTELRTTWRLDEAAIRARVDDLNASIAEINARLPAGDQIDRIDPLLVLGRVRRIRR